MHARLRGAQDVEAGEKNSMLVVSEFVGCSPSVSGAIRVNPWSIDSLADGIYTAIKAPARERHLRHDKHWRYVSQHTVRFWAQVRPRAHLSAALGLGCGWLVHVVALSRWHSLCKSSPGVATVLACARGPKEHTWPAGNMPCRRGRA